MSKTLNTWFNFKNDNFQNRKGSDYPESDIPESIAVFDLSERGRPNNIFVRIYFKSTYVKDAEKWLNKFCALNNLAYDESTLNISDTGDYEGDWVEIEFISNRN